MPELPEVEAFRAFLEMHLEGRDVVRARALDEWMLKDASPAFLSRRLRNRAFDRVERRGKVCILFARANAGERDAPTLLLHFGMTGHPVVCNVRDPVHPWDRLVLDLNDAGSVRYRNMRRLGFIRLVRRSDLGDVLWPLGPDPLEAPRPWFVEALGARRGPVKAILLDQGFLAGVGNLYADEALYEGGIRPSRRGSDLGSQEAERLYRILRRRLKEGVRSNLRRMRSAPSPGPAALAPMRLDLPRRRGDPCPRCGSPIRMDTIGGRSSYWCPRCQQ